ncbi:MAG: M23 family metallopeptidase [Acutalibacteraceae bacterium]
MSIEYKDRGGLHKLFSSAKLKKHSSKPLFKIASKPLLALETTALFAKDLITNHFVGKETHIRFERKKSSSGKFHTTVKLVRADKPVYREPGLLHRARDFRRRFEGVPSFSVEKKLNNIQPKTVKGKVILTTSRFTVRTVKKPLKLAGKALLSADTVAYTASSAGLRKLTNNARAEFNQADTGKVVLSAATAVRTFSRARKAIVRKRLRKASQKIKKQTYTAEKAKAIKKKADYKKEKRLFKAEKKKNKAKIKTIKQKKNFNINRVAVLKGKTAFEKEKLKLEKKKFKNQKGFKKHARKQKHLDMAVPLSLTATAFLGGQMIEKFSQSVISADPDNDFVKAIDESARAINSIRRQTSNVSKRVRHKNSAKRQSKLNKKHNKLQNKSSKLQKNKKKKVKRKQKAAKTKAKSAKAVSNALMKFGKFAVKLFFSMLAPVLFVLMLFSLAMMLFGGGSSNSTYILGTYNCRDYDIACAVEHYTSLANNMNNNISKAQNSSNWKTGLRSLGVSQATLNTYEDTPDQFVFGQSDVFPSVPVYDFEADKLIAFMCAYTYPFTDDNAGDGSTDNGDIVPWTYSRSEHDSVINELFELEYEFRYRYINTSHWVKLPSYESSGYLYADSTGITTASNGIKYGFITFADLVPSDLKSFAVGNTVYFELQYGEVINRNKSFGKTGYYIQNLNLEYTAPNGSVLKSFYSIFHDPKTGENFFGYMGPNNVPQRKTQLYIGDYKFDYAIAKRDANIWTGDQTIDKQLVRYYRAEEYIKECKLYTTVRRTRTFDQAIEYMLRHKDGDSRNVISSRIQFYNTLMALDKEPDKRTYGNHMMYLSPLTTDFKALQGNGKIYNNHGYDMQGWLLKHCGIDGFHNGMDIEAASGARVNAIISGKVESIDTSKHLLVLQSTSDFDYWYENKKHATKVYYENINPSVSVGDEVKAGDKIGVVDSYKHCYDNKDNTAARKNYLHLGVEIQYDWWVWESVDPQFLFYRSDTDVVAKSE